MAVLDPHNDCVVVRIVYDGAPLAGKTTSIAALGRGLGASVFSPADLDGRTLFFDWLDYTGGLFEGRRIRCQIVSVPGQASLAPRRRKLLQSADAVVFVGDSSAPALDTDGRYLRAMYGVLQAVGGPPIGVVMQANKRDLPDAAPLEKVREMLDAMEVRIGIVESVAAEGTGVREAFVFAVRLALDRVRELMRNGELEVARPRIDKAQELLAELQQGEDGMLDLATENGLIHTRMQDIHAESPASQALQEVLRDASPVSANSSRPAGDIASHRGRQPSLPDERVASGLIWPPVTGRLILHETTGATVMWEALGDGGWSGTVDNRWRVHSSAGAFAASLEDGRTSLLQWARTHAASIDILSKERCIALGMDADGEHRLWQFVRVEQPFRAKLQAALGESMRSLACKLLYVVRSYLQLASSAAGAACDLPLNLDTVGTASSGAVYLGLMPEPNDMRPVRPASREQATERLFEDLAFLRPELHARGSELLAEMARLSNVCDADTQHEWSLLQQMIAR